MSKIAMHCKRPVQSEIACAIIAGGKNKRMGQHKAFLKYHGRVFIDVVHENMRVWFDDIFIVTNQKALFADQYEPVYEDIMPNLGPLGALLTALTVARTEYVFCVACDMPNPCDAVIARLILASRNNLFDCHIPLGVNGPEPLFALYRKSLIPLLKDEIRHNWLKLSRIYEKCNTNYVDIGSAKSELVNINTPEEYRRYACQPQIHVDVPQLQFNQECVGEKTNV
ncbi:MAG: molybdenum cofactor guanylyltransferase [Methanosarcinaceae archaeon]|nr:molybdenum cofactor guanylyltransferase [Methanosarcinaceae archaeon]